MTKLSLLVGTFIMSTILSPVEAIDVNIPGADPKIPKDAYINYQATNPAIEQDVANYVEALKATDKIKGISKSEIEYAKATVFSYSTVTYSTWDSMKMTHRKNGKKTTLTADTINFKPKGFGIRSPLYHAGFVYYDNNPILNKVPTDKLLASYVLPPVQNLNELNQYSRIENLNGVLYRVPKDAIYEGESKDSDHQDIRYYQKGDITFFVSTDNIPKNPYARNLVVNGHYNFKSDLDMFWDIYYYHPTSDYINYAFIWNNNIPGLSTHIYKPHKDNHILTFHSYDGTYSFTYVIFYPSFLRAEEVQKLRNMIEFFDSTNNPSFKLKEHILFPDTAERHTH